MRAADTTALAECCPDLEQWPLRWQADEHDIVPGQRIVEFLTPFLIEEEGGPLIWPRITEAEQNSFDATCRKLYKYLNSTAKPAR